MRARGCSPHLSSQSCRLLLRRWSNRVRHSGKCRTDDAAAGREPPALEVPGIALHIPLAASATAALRRKNLYSNERTALRLNKPRCVLAVGGEYPDTPSSPRLHTTLAGENRL